MLKKCENIVQIPLEERGSRKIARRTGGITARVNTAITAAEIFMKQWKLIFLQKPRGGMKNSYRRDFAAPKVMYNEISARHRSPCNSKYPESESQEAAVDG